MDLLKGKNKKAETKKLRTAAVKYVYLSSVVIIPD